MKPRLYIVIAVALAGLFYWSRDANIRPPEPTLETNAPLATNNHTEQKDANHPDAVSPQYSPPGTTPLAVTQREFEIEHKKVDAPATTISIETAAESSWPTDDYAREMFSLMELSENRPPPGPNDPKIYRGFFWKSGSGDAVKHIELRFEGESWIVSTGDSPDQMEKWAPRDIIPFQDRPNDWTIYLDKNEGLFLRHLPKVTIPELNGEFEVLSGWIMSRSPPTATHVALIEAPDKWPPKALTIRLFPTKPKQ